MAVEALEEVLTSNYVKKGSNRGKNAIAKRCCVSGAALKELAQIALHPTKKPLASLSGACFYLSLYAIKSAAAASFLVW